MEQRETPVAAESPEGRRAHTIAVTSGKGGVGKSNIALNLAIALAEADQSVCLFDANLGLGNIDLLCGLNGYWNLAHVVTGARTLNEVVLAGPGGINVVPGASGLADIADCPPPVQDDIFRQLEELERTHDYIVLDTGAGIHRLVRQFLLAADIVLVVSTPETTSIADAYATVKSLSAGEMPRLFALVNQADSPEQGRAIVERLQQTARLFLRTDVGSADSIPRDDQVPAAVAKRTPLVIGSPHAPAAKAIRQLAQRVRTLTTHQPSQRGLCSRFRHRQAVGSQ
jgi:flagellar biosynthesis protein FlhG